MSLSTLRTRISAAIALTCISLVMIFAAILYQASESLEFALARQFLAEELTVLEGGGTRGAIPRAGVAHYVARTPAEADALPRFLRELKPGFYELHGDDGRELHVGVQSAGTARYIVSYDIGVYEEREADFKLLVVVLATAAALLALIAGHVLGGLLTRQLQDLADRVATSEPRQPTAFSKPRQDREVAVLALALDAYQQRIAEMLRREQEFTANVSHELRTPVTAIRTTGELLAMNAVDAVTRDRATEIVDLTDGIADSVSVLLFLAREQAPQEREEIAIHDAIDDAQAAFRTEIASNAILFHNEVPGDHVVVANRQGLQIVLNNLISNAIRNTVRGHVRVRATHDEILVVDTGSGIAPDELPHIFERRYRAERSSDGLGLGLDIVKRVCDLLGWSIHAQSELGAGSTFTIRFARRGG